MKVTKGLKINYITVIGDEYIKDSNGKQRILCHCECGKDSYLLEHTIRTGRIRDCGCGLFMLKRLVGQKFGKLTVIDSYRKRIGKNNRINIICVCKCDCGNIISCPASRLKHGQEGCGCLNKFNFDKYKNKTYNGITIINLIDYDKKIVECKCKCGNIFKCKLANLTAPKHHIIGCNKCPEYSNLRAKYIWNSKTNYNRIFRIFNGMKLRCYNKDNKDYKWYGGKGVKICDEWLKSKSSFYNWAMSNGYADNLTIDRIDSNGNYEPCNCRWVSMIEQQNNKKSNVKYEYNGQYLTVPQIARLNNININTFRSRMRKYKDIYFCLNIGGAKNGV